MTEKQAALVLRGAIWVLLLTSFGLIMAGLNNAGMILACVSLVLNLALQRDAVRGPLIARLTGQAKK
ncbi:hypothetical protein [Roseovarius sp. MMSF_3281]|uniref:hypothetical protein n=1 Tax=Roseovarius sp. MMSF_3281 TaxID=3046694 RepID=UPI00273D1F3D|nr:hypothetical protein [Roseovarius sp. MMSF_3281]